MEHPLSDEQLVLEFQQGHDSECFARVAERYRGQLAMLCRKRFLRGGEYDDLYQEALVGLLNASETFDPARGVSFFCYASVCVNSALNGAVRRYCQRRLSPLNDALPLEELVLSDNMRDYIGTRIRYGELCELISKCIDSLLSELERRCVKEYIAGGKIEDITKLYGYSNKQVDNALFRARKKLRRMLEAYLRD